MTLDAKAVEAWGTHRMQPIPERSERDVTANIVNFLRAEGWAMRRKNVGLFYTKDGRGQRIGTPGEPDWEAIRGGQHFDVEMKAPGRKPEPAQLEYIARFNAIGNVATWADSFEMFEKWYRENVDH